MFEAVKMKLQLTLLFAWQFVMGANHVWSLAISECSSEEFRCVINSACVPIKWKCDGAEDCPDGSDESSCSAQATDEIEY